MGDRVAISAPLGGLMAARPIDDDPVKGDVVNRVTDAYFASLVDEEISIRKGNRVKRSTPSP